MKQFLMIIFLCTAFAILFGVIHNQASVRVSYEYFSIGHRKLIESTSPSLMAIAWGIHPNWWVGACFGFLLALAARVGKWPRRTFRSLLKPVLLLFPVCAVSSAVAGMAGFRLAQSGELALYGPLAASVPPEGHAAYIAALWMHTASYTAGTMGVLITALFVFTGRIRSGISD